MALANVRFAAGLERKVAERTAELEQRAGELTIINSIQQGIAGSLDFQGIVDLVGDKLREVLRSDDIGIAWIDHETRLVQPPVRHRARRSGCIPRRCRSKPGGPSEQLLATREPQVIDTPQAEHDRAGRPSCPAPTQAQSDGMRADHRQRPRARLAIRSRTTSASTPSANPRCAC